MSLWSWKRSGWVNVSLAIFLIIAVITSACSSGLRSRFQVFAPNFSFHGGELYPEVGLFNFLLICSAIFGLMSVVLRYSYIMDQIQVMPKTTGYINKVSIAMGVISFVGLLIISAFSVSLAEKGNTIQSLGTYIFIGVGVIFTILQTVLTFSSKRYSLVFIIRLLLAIILLFSFVTSIIFTEKSRKTNASSFNQSSLIHSTYVSFTEKNETIISRPHNQKDLLTACILEWTAVIVYALFYLSFFQEFQTISAYIILRPFIGSTNNLRSSSVTVNERF